jgi:hypothetical protein
MRRAVQLLRQCHRICHGGVEDRHVERWDEDRHRLPICDGGSRRHCRDAAVFVSGAAIVGGRLIGARRMVRPVAARAPTRGRAFPSGARDGRSRRGGHDEDEKGSETLHSVHLPPIRGKRSNTAHVRQRDAGDRGLHCLDVRSSFSHASRSIPPPDPNQAMSSTSDRAVADLALLRTPDPNSAPQVKPEPDLEPRTPNLLHQHESCCTSPEEV